MWTDSANTPVDFGITVETTKNRGSTPEEIAERCVRHIISVSDNAPDVIKAQALAYKEQMLVLICFYLKEAIKSNRTNVYNMLCEAGQPKLAEALRRI